MKKKNIKKNNNELLELQSFYKDTANERLKANEILNNVQEIESEIPASFTEEIPNQLSLNNQAHELKEPAPLAADIELYPSQNDDDRVGEFAPNKKPQLPLKAKMMKASAYLVPMDIEKISSVRRFLIHNGIEENITTCKIIRMALRKLENTPELVDLYNLINSEDGRKHPKK